jgi:hypothetical protein
MVQKRTLRDEKVHSLVIPVSMLVFTGRMVQQRTLRDGKVPNVIPVSLLPIHRKDGPVGKAEGRVDRDVCHNGPN